VSLTVGELNGIITIDDRAVNPALRRAEQALRQAGSNMGDDAEQAGQQAGQQLGAGFVRGADGQWRNMQAQLVDAVTAAALEAEREAHQAGRRIASGVGDGFDGLRGAAARAGQQAGDALGDGLTDGAADGADGAVAETESKLSKLKTAALGVGAAAGAVLIDAFGEAMDQGQITAKMGASLGATPAEAQRYGKIAGDLFAHAITDDFQTAADSVKAVMGAGIAPPEATNKQLASMATKAQDLASQYDEELGGVTRAVAKLMATGLAKSADEAFDLIAAGYKTSANQGGDFLDTINEYSVQFKRVGLDGKTAFGLIDQAIDAGARDSDQVADAIGQFGELAIGQSKGVQDAFKSIGLDSDKIATKLKKGGKSGQEALQMTTDALRNTKDQTTRLNAATALFGDPGTVMGDALFAMDPAGAAAASGLDKAKGSAKDLGDGLRDNAAHSVAEFKQSMQQGLVGFLGNTVIPKLMTFVGFLKDHQGELKAFAAVLTAVVVPALLLVGGKAMWAGIQMARAWVIGLGPIGWTIAAIAAVVVLVIAYWDEIKHYTGVAWSWVVDKVKWAKDGVLSAIEWLGQIPGRVAAWWTDVKTRTAQIATSWVAWVSGLPGKISGAIAAMAGYLAARGSEAFTALRNAAATKAVAMIAWVQGLPGRISGAIGAVGSLLYSKGQQVVQGLWSGIQSMGSWIYNQLIGWAKSMIPGPIAKALGIASPSKVTTAQGRWIARGLVAGLTGSSKQVRAASQKLADIVRDSLAPGRKRANALGKISAGTKQLLTLARREEQLADRMKAATKRLADMRKARDKLASDVSKGVLDSANITQQEGSEGNSAESILEDLRADTAAAQRFAKNLAQLRKKGVRADLIAQIAQAGVEQGSAAAASLASASSSQIKAINSQQHDLVVAANKAGATAGSAMYGAGLHAASGLVKGLRSKQAEIEKAMLQIARGMSKAIRKALGIKSPSKVMAQVGAYTAEGLRKGIEGERAAVNRSMSSLVETPSPSAWQLNAGARGTTAGGRTPRVVKVGSDGSKFGDLVVSELRRKVAVLGGDVQFVLGK